MLISDKDFALSLFFPGYPAADTIITTFVLIIGGFLLYRKSWRFDSVSKILIIRLFFACITMIFMSASPYGSIKALIVIFVSFLSYYVFINASKLISDMVFSSLISFYLIIISVQTIISYNTNSAFAAHLTKNLIEIPIGSSNYIATHIIVCVVFLFYNKNKTIFNVVAFLLGSVALLLTFSFGALIAVASILIIKSLFFYAGSKIIQFLTLLPLFLALAYLLLIYFPNYTQGNDNLTTVINTAISKKIVYFLDGNYDRVLSDRFVIFSDAWDDFLENPIIGSSEGVEFRGRENFRSHNLFLEALSKYGTLGFLTLLFPIVIIFKKLIQHLRIMKKDDVASACLLALMAGVIHGLVEPNFFSLQFEFLWWSIAGFAISHTQNVKLDQLKTIVY